MGKKKPEVVARREAMIGNVHVVEVPPGTKIFDIAENYLGMVLNGKAVPNGQTVYITPDDYSAAKEALPARPLPGLGG